MIIHPPFILTPKLVPGLAIGDGWLSMVGDKLVLHSPTLGEHEVCAIQVQHDGERCEFETFHELVADIWEQCARYGSYEKACLKSSGINRYNEPVGRWSFNHYDSFDDVLTELINAYHSALDNDTLPEVWYKDTENKM